MAAAAVAALMRGMTRGVPSMSVAMGRHQDSLCSQTGKQQPNDDQAAFVVSGEMRMEAARLQSK